MMQRKNRKLPELNKLKPQMGGKYTTGQNNKYIFDNPIFEYFISTYVENTQEQQNDYITFEQFKTIVHQIVCEIKRRKVLWGFFYTVSNKQHLLAQIS